jgi:hypothetical protein
MLNFFFVLLRLSTPPGTKFVVTKDIPVKEDLLMLGPGLLKNIGGHVEAMVNEWKASKVKDRNLFPYQTLVAAAEEGCCEYSNSLQDQREAKRKVVQKKAKKKIVDHRRLFIKRYRLM